MNHLLVKIVLEEMKCHAFRLSIQLDNCRVHSSDASKQFYDENCLVNVPHPPYSSDLTPSNFWLLGHIKISLAGRVFNGVDELLETVIEFLNEIQPSELQFAFHHRIE
jgi:hypothetical protein